MIEVTVKTDAKEKRTITIIVGGAEKEEILCESFSVPRTAKFDDDGQRIRPPRPV